MERMQSTYENLVDFNLSESGVHPLTPRELLGRRPRRRARSAAGLHAVERHHRAARARSPRSIPARHRSRRGHQRRLGSQLHHRLAAGRAGRRGGDAGAELHADLGAGARASAARFANGRSSRTRGRPLAPDLDALDALVTARTKLIVICTPNNPTGARLTAASSTIARDRRPSRRLDAVRRGLSRRRARRASRRRRCGAATNASSSPAGCRRPTGCPACASAGSSAPPALVASIVVVSRLHDDRAGALSDRWRASRSHPSAGARLLERTRGILRAQPAADRALAARTRRLLAGSRRRPARSSTCATLRASTRPSW